MTLAVPGFSKLAWTYDNFSSTVIAETSGTSLNCGGSNTRGSAVQLASGANIAQDVSGLWCIVNKNYVAGAYRPWLFTIQVDPSGGSSYTDLIANIPSGGQAITTIGSHARCFFFPIFIKAGSKVVGVAQGSTATTGYVLIRFYGKESRPHGMPIGTYSETIGTITGSDGVSVTPGNSGSWGDWTSLGATAKDLWWFQFAFQCNNTNMSNGLYYDAELGWSTDATNYYRIASMGWVESNSETFWPLLPLQSSHYEGYCPLAAGTTLYVRARCSGTASTGYNCLAIGIGG